MSGFVARRLVQSIIVVAGVLVLTFLMTRVVPSDPASLLAGPKATQAQREQVIRDKGLDRPLYVQLATYFGDFVQGDLGRSLQSKQPITYELRKYLPPTLELILVAKAIALIVGLPLGVFSAAKKDQLIDHGSRIFSVGVVSMPTFWVALLLQLIFFRWLGIMPLGGQLADETVLFAPVHSVTGFVLLDSVITGNVSAFSDACWHILLPAIALAGPALGSVQRMTRSGMIEILNEDYITAGRSYGLPERTILWRYALKNSLGPTATVVALGLGFMLVNTFLVESAFSWPGIGAYVANSVVSLDYPAILGVTVVSAIAYVLLNTAADLVIALDPRVRKGG